MTVVEPEVEAGEHAVLERLLAERAVRTVFQPLVSLDSGQVLGYEALSRGPAGTALERPDLLVAAARRARRLRDLDIACRAAALTAAKAAGLTEPYRLFINAEPEALDGWRSDPEHEHLPLTVVLELTERALTRQPAQLLQTVARVRALGWGVALDDVGADPASLALLPLVQPDVIKLDLALVQNRASAHIAAVVNAVHAEAERSGTVVLAEGIETEQHLRTARAFGATVGQGWYFGRPGPLPTPLPAFAAAAPLAVVPRRAGTDDPSPFDVAAADRPVRDADKRLLIEISKQLETMALAAGDSAIVLAAFQDATFFTAATRRRYTGLVRSCSFVAALGQGMPSEPLPGLRGAVISPGDPLLGEWDIAVLGPHFAACLVARDLGDTGPDMTRRFEFILSHDRELTIRVAASLMSRVWPDPRTTDLPQLPLPRGLLLPAPAAAADVAAGRQIRTRLLNYRADGMPRWNELQLLPVRDTRGALTHYIGVQHGVTAPVEAEARVLHLAHHDALTGLPNRDRLRAALTDALDRGRRTGTATALLFLDLVAFKAINDAHGYDTGDQLLREVAGRLRLGLRADDLLARQGGDEFLLLLADLPAGLAARIAERNAEDLLAALGPAFLVADQHVRVEASIGISLAPTDADTPDQLLRQADAAMYAAKRSASSFWSRPATTS